LSEKRQRADVGLENADVVTVIDTLGSKVIATGPIRQRSRRLGSLS